MSRLALLLLLALASAYAFQQKSVQKALELVAAGKLDQAAAMLLDLETADPRNADVSYRLGLVLIKEGKLEEARPHLESAARLDPKHPFVWSALGLLHDSLGKAAARNDAPAAAREFQEAIRLDPARVPYYLDLAQLFLDHETPEPAEIVLNNAARRFSNNSGVWRLLGLAYFAQGKTREA